MVMLNIINNSPYVQLFDMAQEFSLNEACSVYGFIILGASWYT